MSNLLYAKLAAGSLSKNRSTYFPYLLTCIVCVVTFYIISAISRNQGMSQIRGAAIAQSVFFLGTIIIGLFSAVLLFYTNSFLIKRRKKELGLYCVLGMEKRHVGRVLFFEALYTGLCSLAVGLFLGVLLSKLMFLLLLKLLQFDIPLAFGISWSSVGSTLVLFGVLFLVMLTYNLIHMSLANPIELLRGGNQGEKEPKTSWLLTLLGIAALCAGYVIALTVSSPLEALNLFFVAVILVIAGTYFLFISGSIALLKTLRNRKKFYYRPKNFISVSGMLYRMKQNAAGLASICILSTMVLVTVSSTVSMTIGRSGVSEALYPREFISHPYGQLLHQEKEVASRFRTLAAQHKVSLSESYEFHSVSVSAKQAGTRLFPRSEESSDNMVDSYLVTLVSLDEYNALEQTSQTLDENQVLAFLASTDRGQTYGESVITLGTSTFRIKEELSHMGPYQKGGVSDHYFIVVKDEQKIRELYQSFTGTVLESMDYEFGFDLTGTETDRKAFSQTLKTEEYSELGMIFRKDMDQEWIVANGSFMFLGMFFGVLFLIATVMIIYYKQISEGFDDHDRFHIMQQVGMSQKEVRSTIQKQILMVFFLPLIAAVLHVLAAFPAICKILVVFNMNDPTLFMICTAVSILVFAVFYVLVYQITARTYYRLVESGS